MKRVVSRIFGSDMVLSALILGVCLVLAAFISRKQDVDVNFKNGLGLGNRDPFSLDDAVNVHFDGDINNDLSGSVDAGGSVEVTRP